MISSWCNFSSLSLDILGFFNFIVKCLKQETTCTFCLRLREWVSMYVDHEYHLIKSFSLSLYGRTLYIVVCASVLIILMTSVLISGWLGLE